VGISFTKSTCALIWDFYARCAAPTQPEDGESKRVQFKKSPADRPGRGAPCASREDRPRERRRLLRVRAAAAGQLHTPAGGRGSEPVETVKGVPRRRSATFASAMPLADADGWS